VSPDRAAAPYAGAVTTTDPTPAPATGWTEIASADELVALLGEPTQMVREKGRPALLEVDRDWLAASPFCVLATAGADGTCDASPKGDPAGRLVHVVDDRTIALAERPGNRRADGYHNILENPHVGLTFVIPGRGDTLRVNGRARLVSDAPFFDEMVVKGHRPVLAIVVDIEDVFFHCAKAFLRSGLWQPETWDPEGRVPRRALIAKEVERPGMTIEQLDDYYRPENYAKALYG
jgi:PPOX class probable FMN-dependent enzyme